MKKLIIAVLVALWILSGSFAYTAYYFGGQGEWHKTHCALCNKTIYKWVMGGFGEYPDMTATWYPLCPGEKASPWGIKWQKHLDVCDNCYDEYNTEFDSLMEKTFKEWVLGKIVGLKPIREKFAEEERQEKLKELKEERGKLEEEIKKLEAEK